ncbi:tetratricopeptide repeat protein [bacterium]|nr:tetratricopeptide repeat protein [bacterium]
MQKVIVSITLLFTLLISPSLWAQRIPNAELHTLVRKGIQYSGEQRYSDAKKVFDRAIHDFPKHPAGYLNKAILLQVISLDFEAPVPMPEYLDLLEKARTLGDQMLRQKSTRSEGQYYIGMARSYIAYYQFRDGENWISGLSEGLKATDYLEECLESNPKAYDAMTGVGTYKYWKSQNMSFLTWTPLVDDERRAGIHMLRTAEKHASYTSQQASNSLIWIHIEEEQWDTAIRIAQRVLKRFPRNRLFLWGLASAAEGKEDWKLARSAYERIVASIDDEVLEKRYIEMQARAKIASMSYMIGDIERAMKECDWMRSRTRTSLQGLTEDGKDRIERRREEMEELYEELH